MTFVPATIPDYTARLLSPILPVADMDHAVQFYGEVFGFEPVVRSADYAVLCRGNASLHLTRATDASVSEAVRGHVSFYLEVEEIDALWAHVSQFADRYRMRAPFDREYGMREFHVADWDECLILVGQQIKVC